MYRFVMISTKDATNVSPSYMTALATAKKNMYYTRMLLARCNNALMSGIIDSFFTSKYMGGGGKNVRCLKCVRKQNATRATTYVLLAPRDPLEIDDVIGFVSLITSALLWIDEFLDVWYLVGGINNTYMYLFGWSYIYGEWPAGPHQATRGDLFTDTYYTG